jgi:hypothetical protein
MANLKKDGCATKRPILESYYVALYDADLSRLCIQRGLQPGLALFGQ